MKHFFAAYHTDAGIRKGVNQDSLLLKLLKNDTEEILFAVLCDGMGGMQKGELASATVIRTFSEWFDNNYVKGKGTGPVEKIQKQWKQLFAKVNAGLIQYGKESGVSLGSTATAILLSSNGTYLIGHVGDTRIYRMNEKVTQLTEDHVYSGNILLQCIGVNEFIKPQFLRGFVQRGESILLCSDGFRHVVTEKELYENLHRGVRADIEAMKWKLVKMIELNKKRKEKDNISAILIKVE